VTTSGEENSDNLQSALAEKECKLGLACAHAGRRDEAISWFRRALERQPDCPEACNGLGVLLLWDDVAEAEALLGRAVKLRPDYAIAHSNLGAVLDLQGELSEESVARSLASLRRAVELRSDSAVIRHNYGMALLRAGNFAEGWREFEWRLLRYPPGKLRYSLPCWSGTPLDGKTIVLWDEEGMGDSLQFVRYAQTVKQRGARVIVECRRELAGLLKTCPGVDEVVVIGTSRVEFDEHVPLLSLPWALGTELSSIPPNVPYLFPEPALVEKWRQELRAESAFKIGIAWQGNPDYQFDRFRSIPLANFAPLAGAGDVRLYSLQLGAGREQLADVQRAIPITDLADRIGDFQNTAAIMRNLDLVIACDSAPAHLAGALGVPVWVPLPYVANWRWLLDRADSPWYPTMRLYRQSRPGDWQEVFARIAAELAATCRAGSRRVESC
jgi:hypothetical protein